MSLSEPGLDREEADRALNRLAAESDRIAEALVAMDGHPGHQLLRTATLTGVSKERWVATSTAMSTLWEQFEAYRTLLDRARAVRDRRSRPGPAELDELTELLTRPVVELNQEQVPIERRSLTGPALSVDRITVSELVTRMKATFTTVTAVLAEADGAVSGALRRIDPLEAELSAVTALAGSVGHDPAALHRIRDRITEARHLVAADPLGLPDRGPGDPLSGAETDLAGIREAIAGLVAVRDSFDQRVAALSAALGEIEAAVAQARAADAEVQAKIANSGLAPVGDPAPALRTRVTGLAELRRAADWPRLAGELGRLDRDAAAALAEAKDQLAARVGLFDRRAELRGRLDAYRAKAAKQGRAEELPLAALHGAAQDLLYIAPCDLAAATRAVNRYQQAVQEGPR
ncbi:MAG TPA: hypothetical protein VGR06_39395 [Actinophytocola sp.]|jgi:hypothetical protein|uniref:hypothetical protein n=1 Tax=Actinophytocola sp. TaxID=1872138 RepID=UPI002DF9DE9B|nr:hypothetical protein [Actinophytocola sp.]